MIIEYIYEFTNTKTNVGVKAKLKFNSNKDRCVLYVLTEFGLYEAFATFPSLSFAKINVPRIVNCIDSKDVIYMKETKIR